MHDQPQNPSMAGVQQNSVIRRDTNYYLLKQELYARAVLPTLLPFVSEGLNRGFLKPGQLPSAVVCFLSAGEFLLGMGLSEQPPKAWFNRKQLGRRPTVELKLAGPEAFIRLCEGGSVLPGPGAGFWRVRSMQRLQKVSAVFQEFLLKGSLPGREGEADPFLQARLLMHLTLETACALVAGLPALQESLKPFGSGRIRLEIVDAAGKPPAVYQLRMEEGRLNRDRKATPDPTCDVRLRFPDPELAVRLFRQEEDPLAASGKGWVRVEGRIPLADGLNLVFDQIPKYVPMP